MNMKKVPASRLRPDRKYKVMLKRLTPMSLTGKREISDAMASIPGWYIAKLDCFSCRMLFAEVEKG